MDIFLLTQPDNKHISETVPPKALRTFLLWSEVSARFCIREKVGQQARQDRVNGPGRIPALTQVLAQRKALLCLDQL